MSLVPEETGSIFLRNVGTYLPDLQDIPPHTAILLGLKLRAVRTSNLTVILLKLLKLNVPCPYAFRLHFSEPTSRPFSAISKAYQLVTQRINLTALISLCLKYSVTNSYRFNVSQLYFYLTATMMHNFIITDQLLSTNNTLQFIVKNGTLKDPTKP
jgi:hypothetical protein